MRQDLDTSDNPEMLFLFLTLMPLYPNKKILITKIYIYIAIELLLFSSAYYYEK